MKKTIVILLAFLCLLGFKAKSQVKYDDFFTDQQLRIDYYLFGNADTVSYALDKLVKEPK